MFEKILIALLVYGSQCSSPPSQETDAGPSGTTTTTTTTDPENPGDSSGGGGQGGDAVDTDGGSGGGDGGGGSGQGGDGGQGGAADPNVIPLGGHCPEPYKDCADGLSCAPWHTPNAQGAKGMCTTWCVVGDPTDPCAPGQCWDTGGGGRCLPPCLVDADCPVPLVCIAGQFCGTTSPLP